MRLHVELGDQPRTVALSIESSAATIRQLADALGAQHLNALAIDGKVYLADAALVDIALVDGSHVSAPKGQGSTSELGHTWVGVVAGPDAGRVRQLDAVGSVHIGRNPTSDLQVNNDTISDRHAQVSRDERERLTIVDLDSHNGTWVGDALVRDDERTLHPGVVARLGSSLLVVREVDRSDRPLASTPEHASSAGTILYNRPPRRPVPATPAAISLPDPVEDRAAPKLSVVALIVPVIFAAVMVAVTGSWRYAMFALLSPLMAIGNWISGRRRVAAERKGDIATHRDALERLRVQLAEADTAERLRRAHIGPDLLEVRRRMQLPSSRLWERRLGDDDALTLRLGLGSLPWSAPLDAAGPPRADAADDVEAVLAEAEGLGDIELLVDLRAGVFGLFGDEGRCRGAMRALVLQLTAAHGPADVRVVLVTDDRSVRAWEWMHWLPHTASSSGPLVLTEQTATALADQLLESYESTPGHRRDAHGPAWVFVIDDVGVVHRRGSALRRLLEDPAGGFHGIVRAAHLDQLPASAVRVAEVDAADGGVRLFTVGNEAAAETGLVDGLPIDAAEIAARSIARFDDPERDVTGGGVPDRVTIADVLPEPSPESLRAAWNAATSRADLRAPLGVGADGPVLIDLVGDGPHGLVAGTTGAGKSELLRTLVIGLAANHSPDDLVFVLVDYKGGAAFDCCADLPHVVGMVTDLDDHLAQRALRSLEAELHHRESVLRTAAVKDILDYRSAGSPGGPLPRLVVVIDEFATLRSELPEFVTSLVGIAQRGRSLGVHLILATQRPSGAVDANIRANTNLRIALRVQHPTDSNDVIDVADAAELPRNLPGRAYVRRGEGDVVLVQSAYASGTSLGDTGPALTVTPMLGGRRMPSPMVDDVTPDLDAVSDLALYVDACSVAAAGIEPPRSPWLDPLPDHIDRSDLDMVAACANPSDQPAVFALGDDPDHQRRVQVGWDPRTGHVGVVGSLGSGVTTTLKSVALAAARADLQRPTWVYVADHSAKGFTGFDRYPVVARIIDGEDEERHERLVSFLESTLERRQQTGGLADGDPHILVVIDGIAGFVERLGMLPGSEEAERFARIVRDGPSVGISLAVGAASPKDFPRGMRGSFRTTVVHELVDANDYGALGVKSKDLPTFVPGRAVTGDGGEVVQVIPLGDLVEPLDFPSVAAPAEIEALEASIPLDDLPQARLGPPLEVPIGKENLTREVAQLVARTGEHLTIAGPAGSGRTTALLTIARQVRAADAQMPIVAVTADPEIAPSGVFDAVGTLAGLEPVFEALPADDRRWLIVVDDADVLDDEFGVLTELARKPLNHVTLVIAVRSTTARQAFGHWTRFVRGSGIGVILQPDNAVDGELFGVRLPRGERLPARPGRGYLVGGGVATDVQLAH